MSIIKPLAIIDSFGGMGVGNIYHLDGMYPDNMSGQSILSNGELITNKLSKAEADFDGCCDIALAFLKRINDEPIQLYATWNGSDIRNFDSPYITDIHSIVATGSGTDQILAGSNDGSSILSTENGHLLYTIGGHLGYGYSGNVSTDSTTTTLRDDTTNFGDITAVTDGSASTIKVYNFTTEEEYTVTSITTTTNTNDTLNFTAASVAPSEDDVYMVFTDGKWKFNVSPDGRDNQFTGQAKPILWHRRIVLWEDAYYIANGNFIARLSLDLATWDAEYIQLPARTQVYEIDTNSSKMLISCDVDGRGLMALWDGRADGTLLNKIELPSSTYAMTRHETGFVYNLGAKLYYTDGYSSSIFATIPNVEKGKDDIIADKINNIKSFFGKIYMIAIDQDALASIKSGVLIYSTEYGFNQIPTANNEAYNYYGEVFGLFPFRQNGSNDFFVSYDDSESLSTVRYAIGELASDGAKKSSVIFNIKLDNRSKISVVELNIGHIFRGIREDIVGLTSDITVSTANGYKPFWGWGKIDNDGNSTTTSISNTRGEFSYTAVGEQVFMLQGNNGGEKSYVTAIADGGTSSEVLTISPALTNTPDATESPNYNITSLHKAGSTQTITQTNNNETLLFAVNNLGYTDNFFVEVFIEGNLKLDILNVKIK